MSSVNLFQYFLVFCSSWNPSGFLNEEMSMNKYNNSIHDSDFFNKEIFMNKCNNSTHDSGFLNVHGIKITTPFMILRYVA